MTAPGNEVNSGLMAPNDISLGCRPIGETAPKPLPSRSRPTPAILFLEPPAVTWLLHITLLEAMAGLGLVRPDIGALWKVDHLHVQEALARLQAEEEQR
jgi:hypothetical protein